MTRNTFSIGCRMLVVAIAILAVGSGFGCEEDEAETPPIAPANRGPTPPVITVDLVQICTKLGVAFQGRADGVSMMAQGKTLNAQQSASYFQSMMDVATISKEISDMLQKNPRWQPPTTKALEVHTKAGIIALYHAENALKKAKQAGRAGSTTGKCPADIAKFVADNDLIISRVRGLMPYSKSEMDPSTKK